ncbi:hypothetical protein AB6O49_14705 [Streptomyces sp. SBR177]
MLILSEYEYRDRRYVSLGLQTPGEPQTLHAVADGALRDVFLADGGPEAVTALVEAAETLTVTAGDPELHALPPLLPSDGASLVSGFLGTHKSKADAIESYDGRPPIPKWYFKGLGSWLRVPGQDLVVPAEPLILIEEAELALVHLNDDDGTPTTRASPSATTSATSACTGSTPATRRPASCATPASRPTSSSPSRPARPPAARSSSATASRPGRASSTAAPTPCTSGWRTWSTGPSPSRRCAAPASSTTC